MNNITPETFDPRTAPGCVITPTENGWILDKRQNFNCSGPRWVFNSPAELAKAVANLVQFGTIERPPEKERSLRPGFRPIAELPDCGNWWEFDTATGIQEMFVASGKVSGEGVIHSDGGSLRLWIEQAGVIGFRSR